LIEPLHRERGEYFLWLADPQELCLWVKSRMCNARAHVCYGPIADVAREPYLRQCAHATFVEPVTALKSAFHVPGGNSPGSSATHIFFIADGVSDKELEHDVRALKAALKSDFRTLEAQHGQESAIVIGKNPSL
jgi:hypothetical protein